MKVLQDFLSTLYKAPAVLLDIFEYGVIRLQ